MKKYLLIIPLIVMILLGAHLFTHPDQPETQGVIAYVSSETPLYRKPTNPNPFASIPSGEKVRWLSTTEDYAFGYIEAEVNGETVFAYAPWLALNIINDGTESAQAMEFLRTNVGWTEEEIEEYGMYIPAYYMRYQFVNVEVRSRSHPEWVYYIWLDKLNGGLHDIQSPFTGESQPASEKTIRDTLRSGAFTSADEVKAYFVSCYGPEESWSRALAEWAEAEYARMP